MGSNIRRWYTWKACFGLFVPKARWTSGRLELLHDTLNTEWMRATLVYAATWARVKTSRSRISLSDQSV